MCLGEFLRVHPVIRRALRKSPEQETGRKAVRWYEEHGYISEALECCRSISGEAEYQEFLVRNYDRLSFLPGGLNLSLDKREEEKPELFFLKWMEGLFQPEMGKDGEVLPESLAVVQEAERTGKDLEKWREVFLISPM